MAGIIPWSYSSWSAYQTCPRQFYELRIAKSYVQPESPPMIWGNKVHKALENYVKITAPIPDTMRHMMPLVDRVLASPGVNYAELELACTEDLQPTGFWDADAYCRGKGDLVKVNATKALNADYKTGKVKPNSLQLDLMACLTFAKFPEVQVCHTAFLWFQAPSKPTVATYVRADVPKLMDQFAQGVADMKWSQDNHVWPEKPSGLCRPNPRTGYPGCPVLSCKYNGRNR